MLFFLLTSFSATCREAKLNFQRLTFKFAKKNVPILNLPFHEILIDSKTQKIRKLNVRSPTNSEYLRHILILGLCTSGKDCFFFTLQKLICKTFSQL